MIVKLNDNKPCDQRGRIIQDEDLRNVGLLLSLLNAVAISFVSGIKLNCLLIMTSNDRIAKSVPN